MNTIEDLRRALDEMADQHEAPDPVTVLRAVSGEVATGNAPRSSRRRRLVAAAAAGVVLAAGGYALTQGQGENEGGRTEVPPAEQGWDLVDGAPPEYSAGLKLLTSHEVEFTQDGVIEVTAPTQPEGHVFAVAWCDVGPGIGSANVVAPSVRVTATEGTTQVIACADREGSTGPAGPTVLPSLADDVPYAVDLTGDLPREGSATLAFYGEAPTHEYPFPDAGPIPVGADHDRTIDASTPPADQPELMELLGQATASSTVVESRAGTTATAWAGEPGRLLLAVNGTVLTNDGEVLGPVVQAGPWELADPDVRGGYWHVWTPGENTIEFDLSPAALADRGIEVSEGDPIEVAALGVFARDGWKVGIDLPEGSPDSGTATSIGPTEMLPEYAYGMRQVAAAEVPADGGRHDLDLGAADPAEVLWVVECAGGASTGTASTQIGDTTIPCAPGAAWGLAQRAPGLDGDTPVSIVPSVGPGPVRVAAYLPQDWADYPFEESTTPPVSSDTLLDTASAPPEDGEVLSEYVDSRGPQVAYREVARIGPQDLDDAGRAELSVPSTDDLAVWIETDGLARVRVDVGGEDLFDRLTNEEDTTLESLLVRDGWFSSWTTEPAGYLIRDRWTGTSTGHHERDEPTVTVEIDAEDGVSAELIFYELAVED